MATEGRRLGWRQAALAATALLLALGAAAAWPVASAEQVFLLHGLGRSADSMDALAERLRVAGFRAHSFDYPSTSMAPGASQC